MSENGFYTDIKQVINILSAKGGNYWEKGNFRRVYFNEDPIMEIMKIRAEFYNTGNLNHISVNGEEWSNRQGNMLLSTIHNDKFWYDFSTRDFHTKGNGEYAGMVLDALKMEFACVVIPKGMEVPKDDYVSDAEENRLERETEKWIAENERRYNEQVWGDQ